MYELIIISRNQLSIIQDVSHEVAPKGAIEDEIFLKKHTNFVTRLCCKF